MGILKGIGTSVDTALHATTVLYLGDTEVLDGRDRVTCMKSTLASRYTKSVLIALHTSEV